MPNDDNALKRAARFNDAQAEDHGLHGVCAYLGIDVEQLLHVAQQRALRLVLTESGRGDELARMTAANLPTPIRLSDAEKTKINSATAAYMDGIALGYRAAKEGLDDVRDDITAVLDYAQEDEERDAAENGDGPEHIINPMRRLRAWVTGGAA